MAEYLIQSETLDAIADAINAKTGKSASMTPAEMVTEIESIETGTEITDGIVFTELNASGSPIKADVYGNLPEYAFGYNSVGGLLGSALTNVTFKTPLTSIGWGAFQRTALTELIIPDSVIGVGGEVLRANTAPVRYVHENAGSQYGYKESSVKALNQISNVSSVQLGAVGKPLTDLYYQFMTSRAYASMTLTIYCIGANVDSFLASARRAITEGTIVFKASSDTEYNGMTYAAGDTILTSEVESTS